MSISSPDPDATARFESDKPYRARDHGVQPQFAPGTIVADRYRIAGILGTGGMGEVYRADDTKLGQTVALKFLPARLAHDPVLLDGLHDEVRLGRQIAHPNVCRVYDIVDWDGAHFVAMEFIDGEDLSRLLRRIGRLAHDKAVDIARGIAAGLAAAHAKGILHRDLKPANIMIDSRGDARIMDFGLALGAGDDDGTISGTPAYMAPEDVAGQPATIRSDLYSLGLVMYELFTGRRAHSARTMPERLRDSSSEIATPSSVIRDIDPVVERIILRCLSNDPAERPQSAREVVNALPGGDPLAAALAAGETPSPRLVAAAGTEGSLKLWQAWTLLGVTILFLAMIVYGRHTSSLMHFAPIEKSPEVLAERTASVIVDAGIPLQPYESRSFEVNNRYLAWVIRTDSSETRWKRLRRGTPAVTFHVRRTPQPLSPAGQTPAPAPGTTSVALAPDGRLVSLSVVPAAEWPERLDDWDVLFKAAGLDRQTFSPTEAASVPPVAADSRLAWTGRQPEDETPIRIEAAAWRGTPVHFRVTGEWDAAPATRLPFTGRPIAIFVTALSLVVFTLAGLMAWRNVRLRRGDRAGAFRVAILVLVAEFLYQFASADHQADGLHEVAILQRSLSEALLWAALVYVLYLALEPFVRRRWPDHLISTARLLAGNLRDPMVGRDVLIGLLGGVLHAGFIVTAQALARFFFISTFPPSSGDLTVILGIRHALAHVAAAVSEGMLQGFGFIVILVLFMLVLRRRVLAAAGLIGVMLTGFWAAAGRIDLVMALIAVTIVFIAARYGLLAIAVAQATFHLIFAYPITAGAAWYTATGFFTVALVALAAIWAFRTSLGSQNPFAGALLEQ
ncbi:MAG TPA: bifunctional serine/threonine protein kinase/MFS transporter [Thermoanaerobaculia bacterium]